MYCLVNRLGRYDRIIMKNDIDRIHLYEIDFVIIDN